MRRGGENMVETDYTTLNVILDAALVRAPRLAEGSTFIMHHFEGSDAKYVQEYCRSQGWECKYFPLTEKFWDAVDEHKETVHRFYVRKLDGEIKDITTD